MKKIIAVLLMMAMILSWGLLSFADEVPGQVLLAESFESGNSSSIIAGSAKSATLNAGNGYRGNWTFTTKAESASADGANSMGIDTSSAAVVPMNGILVDGYFLNFVSLHSGKETIYAGDIVFASVMAKLTDDSNTKTVYVRNRMNTADKLTGIVEISDYFASQYPANTSLIEKLDADVTAKVVGGWHGGTDEMWNQKFPVTKLIPVTVSEWTPVRFTMYCKTPLNKSQSVLVNQVMVSDNAGLTTGGRTKIKESSLDSSGKPVYTVDATLLFDDNIVIRVPATAPLSAVYPVAYGAKITQEEANLTADAEIYDVNAYATPSAKYQWQRKVDGEWTDIEGATSEEYVCTEADSEKEMRCQVYAVSNKTDASGVTTEVSSLSNNVC
ncbi:MAG: hypothetical protein E7399_08515, partial [Ruminococcaceae bacterium]|nr:hypothetical protein [Oscillospiraceae bacterium]